MHGAFQQKSYALFPASVDLPGWQRPADWHRFFRKETAKIRSALPRLGRGPAHNFRLPFLLNMPVARQEKVGAFTVFT
jgi:hypothetical protein